HLLQQQLQERAAADRAGRRGSRCAVRPVRGYRGLQPDGRPGGADRDPPRRRAVSLRDRRLPQALPVQRPGRHRPDPAGKGRDRRVRGAPQGRPALAVQRRRLSTPAGRFLLHRTEATFGWPLPLLAATDETTLPGGGVSMQAGTRCAGQYTPWASIASATLTKPLMLAPST